MAGCSCAVTIAVADSAVFETARGQQSSHYEPSADRLRAVFSGGGIDSHNCGPIDPAGAVPANAQSSCTLYTHVSFRRGPLGKTVPAAPGVALDRCISASLLR